MNSILDDILDETCRYFKVDRWDVLSDNRHEEYVNARITFALVANKYVDNKSEISRYLNKDTSTFYNWIKYKDKPVVDRAVSDISMSIKGVFQVYKNMKKYFGLKEELVQLKRKNKQLQDEITEKERLINAVEKDINLEHLKI